MESVQSNVLNQVEGDGIITHPIPTTGSEAPQRTIAASTGMQINYYVIFIYMHLN